MSGNHSASDSDSEFERYMQDSFSSSIASSLSVSFKENRLKKNNDDTVAEGVSTLGLSWLKSPGATSGTNSQKPSSNVQIPLLDSKDLLPQGLLEDDEGVGGARLSTSSGRKLSQISHRSSVTEDPLNFSQSSGVSLLSELEHQLGLRSSRSKLPSPPSHKPGDDTLAEEEDKKRFFEELEKGKDSTLDYSELNRQLNNTSLSMRGGLMSAKQLKTIDENATPHVSSDEESSSHTHLPYVNKMVSANDSHSSISSILTTPSNTSLQSSSNQNLPLPSPLHSSSSHSVTNKGGALKSPPNKSPLKSASLDKLVPINENLSEKSLKHVSSHDKDTPLYTVMEGSLPVGSTDSAPPRGSGDRALKSLQSSKSLNTVPLSSKSASLVRAPFDTQKQNTTKTNKKSNSLQEMPQPQQQQSSAPLIGNKSTGIESSTTKGSVNNEDISKERSLGELLRSLATEELASLTHKILSEEDQGGDEGEESDTSDGSSSTTECEAGSNKSSTVDEDSLDAHSKPVSVTGSTTVHQNPVVVKPGIVSSTTFKKDKPVPISDRHENGITALTEALEFARADLNSEKQHVAELEEMLKDKERQKESIKLEHSQQIRELRTQLLDIKSKFRKMESEKRFNAQPTSTSVPPQDKEQERLILGYQKENEKLYAELTQVKKDYKMTKSELTSENSRLGSDLANLQVKSTAQEEAIRQFKEQLSRYKSYNSKQEWEKHKLLEEKYEATQAQVETLMEQKKKLLSELDVKEKSMLDSKTEQDEITSRHLEHISLLKDELQSLKNALQRESELNRRKLREKDEEIISLRDEIKTSTSHQQLLSNASKPGLVVKGTRKPTSVRVSGRASGPQLVRSRSTTTNDAKKIKELEGQVEELYSALKEHHPNSIPVLMHACASMNTNGSTSSNDDKEVIEYLENRVRNLEKQLLDRDNEERRKMNDFEQRFQEMEKLYDDQIAALVTQIKEEKHHGQHYPRIDERGVVSSPMKDNESGKYKSIARDLKKENRKLKEKMSQLSLELSHVQVQLKGCVAENESERRKTNEQWELKLKRLEEDHKHKVDQLYESFVNNHTIPDIERLKSKLEARETKIRMLEEELNLVKTDGEIMAVLKTREEELKQQIELLNKELMEAKKHHTPEMHHYNSLLAKISLFEARQTAYQQKMSEAITGHGITQEDVDKIKHHYKKKLVEKDHQLEKFRDELEDVMDKLYSLQEGNTIIKQQQKQ